MVELVVFDLDGTLIDSRRDLAGAVNYMRGTMGLEPLSEKRVVSFIGNGLNSLVRRSVADAEIDFDTALARMKKFYSEHLVQSTVLYPGVESGLKELRDSGMLLAVVTNKATSLAVTILEKLGIAGCFCEIIGGDGEYPLKPAPDALLGLQKKYNFKSGNCWMVGDHYTDMEAGRRASWRRILVTYGFGEAREETPDYTVGSFAEFVNVIRRF